ncbi:hypothetical protein V2J09_016423 [Rumex salicifolius]
MDATSTSSVLFPLNPIPTPLWPSVIPSLLISKTPFSRAMEPWSLMTNWCPRLVES